MEEQIAETPIYSLPTEMAIKILSLLGADDLWSCIFTFAPKTLIGEAVAEVRAKQWSGGIKEPPPEVCMRSGIMARAFGRTRAHLYHTATPKMFKMVFDRIMDSGPTVPQPGRYEAQRTFYNACANGRAKLAQWLVARFKLSGESDERGGCNCALQGACENGHFSVAKWLAHRFKLRAPDGRAIDFIALRKACANGHLEVVKWFVGYFELDVWGVQLNSALECACVGGHLKVAKYLADYYELDGSHIRDSSCSIIWDASAAGHLEVVRWLVDHFEIVAGDWCNSALKGACAAGHLAVAKWLVGHFEIVAGDWCNSALQLARENAHTPVIQWLQPHAQTSCLRSA